MRCHWSPSPRRGFPLMYYRCRQLPRFRPYPVRCARVAAGILSRPSVLPAAGTPAAYSPRQTAVARCLAFPRSEAGFGSCRPAPRARRRSLPAEFPQRPGGQLPAAAGEGHWSRMSDRGFPGSPAGFPGSANHCSRLCPVRHGRCHPRPRLQGSEVWSVSAGEPAL